MIKLNETYYLDANRREFILKRKRVVQEGDNAGSAQFDDVGYYPTIDTLIRGLSNLKLYELVRACGSLRETQEELVSWSAHLRTPLVSELKDAVRGYSTPGTESAQGGQHEHRRER